MASLPDLFINAISTFDGKGLRQAETAAGKLTRTVKKLGATFGLALGTAAIVQFGKASVKAFAQDEAAALRLSRAVDNLGIGFANPSIAKYIANLEKSAAIADDVLRPSFQSLLTITGSLTQSQKLLNDAITISRASGVDLATVTDDLGKGYVGITKGLIKYDTGLTRAELTTMSFAEILGVILTRSAGAAQDYLTTTAYKLDVLSIATSNASEKIGQGLVDALARAGGGTEASDAAVFLDTMAGFLNKVTLAAGTAVGGITSVFKAIKNLPAGLLGFAAAPSGFGGPGPSTKKAVAKLSVSEKKQAELLAKLEANSLKRNKELLALKKKQALTEKQIAADKKQQEILDKASLALAQGQKFFDDEGISLAAAAQGKLTDEERTRLALKTDIYNLEAAINENNITAAAALANSMVTNAQKLALLRKDMVGLNDIENPFNNWLLTIQKMAYELSALAMIKPVTSAAAFFTPQQQATADLLTESKNRITAKIQGDLEDRMAALAEARAKIERKIQYNDFPTGMTASDSFYGQQNIRVEIVDNTSGLIQVVQNSIQEINRSGSPLTTAGALP